jgi:hypothetical protein
VRAEECWARDLLICGGSQSAGGNDGEGCELHVEMRGWNDCRGGVWWSARGNECGR